MNQKNKREIIVRMELFETQSLNASVPNLKLNRTISLKSQYWKYHSILFLIIFIVFNCISLNAQYFNVGTNSSFILNDSIVQDTNIKYFCYSNDFIMQLKNNSLEISSFQSKNNLFHSSKFSFALLNLNCILEPSGTENTCNVVIPFRHDSVEYKLNKIARQKVDFFDTAHKVRINFSTVNNDFVINLTLNKSKDISKVKFKVNNIDSMKVDIDSNLIVYAKIDSLRIKKIKFLYTDTSTIDTIIKPLMYKVNTDTLSFFVSNLDTTKGISTLSNIIHNSSEVNSILSSNVANDESLRVANFSNGDIIQLKVQTLNIGYYPIVSSASLTIDSLSTLRLYGFEKYTYNNELTNRYYYFHLPLEDSTENRILNFNPMKVINSDEIVITGYSSKKLSGMFEKILSDSSAYTNPFMNRVNSFIIKINNKCIPQYSNYINFHSNNLANVYVNDYLKNFTDEYLVGQIDTLYQKDSLNISYDKSKLNSYSAFVMTYQHDRRNSQYLLLSDDSTTKFTALSSIDINLNMVNNVRHKSLLIAGFTNANTGFIDTSWIRSYNGNNCNFVINIPLELDTILEYRQIDGNFNEGMFLSKEEYFKNKCSIIATSNRGYYLATLSNSNTFNQQSQISNSKSFSSFTTVIFKFDSMRVMNRALFVDSEFNQELNKLNLSSQGLELLITSKSASFIQPIVKDTIMTDTLTSNSKLHSILITLDDSLSLKINQYNQIQYRPTWLTFIDNDNYDMNYNDFAKDRNKIYLVGRTKSHNSFINSNSKINGNNTFINYDSHLIMFERYIW
jgi:hypothetical protein